MRIQNRQAGVIYLGEFSREAELRREWELRQERLVEGEACRWLMMAETEDERAKTMRLYEQAIRRMWRKRGYSQAWTDKQFTKV